jgi:thiopeptide-type bacteriocin biosynthesis protein
MNIHDMPSYAESSVVTAEVVPPFGSNFEDPSGQRFAIGRVSLLAIDAARELFEAERPLEALRRILAGDDTVRAAIALASPSLADALEPWLAGGMPKKPNAPLKAFAYVVRMATRTTPFGMFAGVGEVTFGAQTTLALNEAATRIAIAPDHGWLDSARLAVQPRRAGALVATNDLVVERAGRACFLHPDLRDRTRGKAFDTWAMTQVWMRSGSALDAARKLGSRPIALTDFVTGLAEAIGAPRAIADVLAGRLLGSGALVHVRPSGISASHRRHAGLSESPAHAAALDAVYRLRDVPLEELRSDELRDLAAHLDALHPGDGCALRADAIHRFDGELGFTILRDAADLARLTARPNDDAVLREYRERFRTFYEGEERSVPLLELVSEDFGIGPPDERHPLEEEPSSPERDAALLRLVARATRRHEREVALDDEELVLLFPAAPARGSRGNACEIAFSVVADDRRAIEDGRYLLVATTFAAADRAGKSAGRFLDALGEDARARAASLQQGERVAGVPAELDFAPGEPRFGNLSLRPLGVRHVIADASTDVPDGVRRISPADIGIALEGGAFVAYARGIGRLAIQEHHLCSAAFFAPAHVRLLSHIGRQGRLSPRAFAWGAAARAPFVPRLRFGRLVLAPAAWTLERRSLAPGRLAEALAAWREHWHVPRHVCLVERDQKLLLDLDSPVVAPLLGELLRTYLGADGLVRFEEFLPGFDGAWLTGERGRYAHEFVVSLPAETPRTPNPAARPARDASAHAVAPSGPGGPWLCLKLYCGAGEIDRLLCDRLPAIRAACVLDEAPLPWFFVRYADPAWHVRLRIRAGSGDRAVTIGRLLDVCEPLLTSGTIRRYAFDTYRPEGERYGGEATLALCERLFHVSSERAADALRATATQPGARLRHAATSLVPFVRCWFDAFAPEAWLAAYGDRARAFAAVDRGLVRDLQAALAAPGEHDPREWEAVLELARRRDAGTLGVDPLELFHLLAHMHFNRAGIPQDGDDRVLAHIARALRGRHARARAGTAR